jgi:hypothetical protein
MTSRAELARYLGNPAVAERNLHLLDQTRRFGRTGARRPGARR